MISDMMAIKAVSALFCDQLSSVLPGDKAMVKGEEACFVCLVALSLESIYIKVVHTYSRICSCVHQPIYIC